MCLPAGQNVKLEQYLETRNATEKKTEPDEKIKNLLMESHGVVQNGAIDHCVRED